MNQLIDQGKQLQQVGRIADAIELFGEALKSEPNSVWLNYHLGDCLERQGDLDRALKYYNQALKIDPGFYAAYEKFVLGKLEPQQLAEVVATYQEIVQQKPQSWVYSRLGNLLTKQQKLQAAIEAYQTATYKINAWRNPEYVKHWQQGEVKGPNFLIIGAMKAGTTSLYEYLSQHPQVLACDQKELHFFVHHFHQGLDWYLAHFPPIPSHKKYVVGEASPGYIVNNIAPLVKNAFPQIKIIALLRNPVDRAISHYHHNWNYGLESRSFEQAIAPELETLKDFNNPISDEVLRWKGGQPGYIYTGIYAYFIKRWRQVFSPEQLLVIKSEDLYQDSDQVTNEVYNFLGLPPHQLANYKQHLSGSYQPLDQSAYQKLVKLFQPYNQKLEEFLGKSFNWD